MHHSILEVSLIHVSVGHVEGTVAVALIVLPLAVVHVAVTKMVSALAVLLVLQVLPCT